MPVRRFHYTGKKRIKQKDIDVWVDEVREDVPALTIEADLSDYDFEDSWRIVIEAYHQVSLMRFDAGTVGLPDYPTEAELSEFTMNTPVRFRLKVVVSEGRHGLVMGDADRLRPIVREQTTRQVEPLLKVTPEPSLIEELFRVSFYDEPELLVNPRCGNWRSMVRGPEFRSLVYPTVFRQVLNRIFCAEKGEFVEDTGSWQNRWARLALSLPGVNELPDCDDTDAIDEFVDRAVSRFCRSLGTYSQAAVEWIREE